MKTIRGLYNGSMVELLEDAPVEDRAYVLITFLEGNLETAASRGQRLKRDVLRPPVNYSRYSADVYQRFTAGALMTREIITMASDATVAKATHLMREKGITSVLIEPDATGEWGIMTMRDLLKNVVGDGRNPAETPLGDIASRPLVYVSPDLSLQECSKRMVESNVRRVVVKQDDRPVGIISDTDIFQFVGENGWGMEKA